MKKFVVLSLAISISIGSVIAQMGKVSSALSYIDQGLLDKAKEALDQAFLNEKSKNNPKTFVAKGKLCQEVFNSDNPKFKSLITNPLEEAYAAYEKALQLDPKGSIKKQLSLNSTYILLGNDFNKQGAQQFEAKDYKGALESFENDIKIVSSDVYIGVIDSGTYFNAGLAAYNGKMYDKAIPYFQKCTDMKYEGTQPHFLIYQSYMEKGDTTTAEDVLKKTRELYPDNKDVILQLLDHYYKTNKVNEAFTHLTTAKATDPNNYSLYWVEGALYMKQEKWTQAIPALVKSAELKPDLFDLQYNLGVCYYNLAVEMFKEAETIMDVNKYNAAIRPANETFIKAIPFFEKANQLKPEDVDALRNLKELYFRLRTINPDYETKYNEVVRKLEGKQ
jgi:tetratricopeptide (TPR) repeat protein